MAKNILVEEIIDNWSEMKRVRAQYEPAWQSISEYIALTRSEIKKNVGELRQKKLVDAHGVQTAQRLIGVLHGHMINPGTPWAVVQTVDEVPENDSEGEAAKWLDHVTRRMQLWYTMPVSRFAVSYSESVTDLVYYGNSYVWLDEKPTIGPVYRTVSHWNMWHDEDEYGIIDKVYRRFTLSAIRASNKYPDSEKLKQIAKDKPNQEIELLHIVQPRELFSPELAKEHKLNRLFLEAIIYPEGKELLAESGRDFFPWAVSRFMKRPDEVYGYGPSELALPDVKLANAIKETTLIAAEQQAMPAILAPQGLFIKKIDRRPGAVNIYDTARAMVVRGDPVQNLLKSGDAQMASAMLNMAHEQIERAFYVDWMTLPDNVAETAAAVNDRRELRTAGMSHMVSRQETEALEPIANHCYVGLEKIGWFNEIPASLDNKDIKFTYRTPLHIAMQRADIDAINRFLGLITQLAPINPDVVKRLDIDKLLEFAANRFGFPEYIIKAAAKVQEQEQADQQAVNDQNLIENMDKGASAALKGAKAVQTLGLTPDATMGMMQ